MQRLRVSVVQYLNTAPLIWGFRHGPQSRLLADQLELSFTTPAACAEALHTGAADVGIIPSIAYQTIENLRIIPGIALAAHGPVESVLLVSRVPLSQVRSVALDASSQTSIALARILFARHWNIAPTLEFHAPNLEEMLAGADAALVIGDPALQFSLNSVDLRSREQLGKLFVYDLAAEWRRFTGHPFVFAFWAARAEKATPGLVEMFTASKDFGLAHLEDIAAEASLDLNLPPAGLARYLRERMQFDLDEAARVGLESFYRQAQELALIPRVRALEFISG